MARGAARRIGHARHDAQQRDLVGRRFFVDQHQVAQQGQGAEAIVRKAEDGAGPCDAGPSEAVGAVGRAQQAQAELLGVGRQFVQRDLVHGARGIRFAQAQADGNAPARREHGGQFAQGAGACRGWYMHPYRRQQDQVERQSQPPDLGQVGQRVG